MHLSNKSRTVALLLAMFLGTFGAHRFYAGRSGSATAMLLISLTVFGLIVTWPWALIDMIVILSGAFRDGENAVIKVW